MQCERNPRAQSAMEYLMTYGWAILVVGIVLFGLYDANAFGGGSTLLAACIAQPGFLCSNPQMNTTGNVTVAFGQSTGASMTITGTACSNGTAAPSSFTYGLGSADLPSGGEAALIFQCPLKQQGVIGEPINCSETHSLHSVPRVGDGRNPTNL